jgi:hypothetical protein
MRVIVRRTGWTNQHPSRGLQAHRSSWQTHRSSLDQESAGAAQTAPSSMSLPQHKKPRRPTGIIDRRAPRSLGPHRSRTNSVVRRMARPRSYWRCGTARLQSHARDPINRCSARPRPSGSTKKAPEKMTIHAIARKLPNGNVAHASVRFERAGYSIWMIEREFSRDNK